jgi:hypothetical protein
MAGRCCSSHQPTSVDSQWWWSVLFAACRRSLLPRDDVMDASSSLSSPFSKAEDEAGRGRLLCSERCGWWVPRAGIGRLGGRRRPAPGTDRRWTDAELARAEMVRLRRFTRRRHQRNGDAVPHRARRVGIRDLIMHKILQYIRDVSSMHKICYDIKFYINIFIIKSDS